MRILFRQGIATHRKVGTSQAFLEERQNGVSLIASRDDPTTWVFAWKGRDFVHTENADVELAWKGPDNGPFVMNTNYWLYVDIDTETGVRSFGYTKHEPIADRVAPKMPKVDQHWFDLANNVHKVYNGANWEEVLRVFAAFYEGASNFISMANDNPKFTGTQVGLRLSTPRHVGPIFFDQNGYPIRSHTQLFFTTEDHAITQVKDGNHVKLGSLMHEHRINEPTGIPAFNIGYIDPDGHIREGRGLDQSGKMFGIVLRGGEYREPTEIAFEGTVRNPDWNWSGPNKLLFADNTGRLVEQPIITGQRSIAYTLDEHTIIVKPFGAYTPPPAPGDEPPQTPGVMYDTDTTKSVPATEIEQTYTREYTAPPGGESEFVVPHDANKVRVLKNGVELSETSFRSDPENSLIELFIPAAEGDEITLIGKRTETKTTVSSADDGDFLVYDEDAQTWQPRSAFDMGIITEDFTTKDFGVKDNLLTVNEGEQYDGVTELVPTGLTGSPTTSATLQDKDLVTTLKYYEDLEIWAASQSPDVAGQPLDQVNNPVFLGGAATAYNASVSDVIYAETLVDPLIVKLPEMPKTNDKINNVGDVVIVIPDPTNTFVAGDPATVMTTDSTPIRYGTNPETFEMDLTQDATLTAFRFQVDGATGEGYWEAVDATEIAGWPMEGDLTTEVFRATGVAMDDMIAPVAGTHAYVDTTAGPIKILLPDNPEGGDKVTVFPLQDTYFDTMDAATPIEFETQVAGRVVRTVGGDFDGNNDENLNIYQIPYYAEDGTTIIDNAVSPIVTAQYDPIANEWLLTLDVELAGERVQNELQPVTKVGEDVEYKVQENDHVFVNTTKDDVVLTTPEMPENGETFLIFSSASTFSENPARLVDEAGIFYFDVETGTYDKDGESTLTEDETIYRFTYSTEPTNVRDEEDNIIPPPYWIVNKEPVPAGSIDENGNLNVAVVDKTTVDGNNQYVITDEAFVYIDTSQGPVEAVLPDASGVTNEAEVVIIPVSNTPTDSFATKSPTINTTNDDGSLIDFGDVTKVPGEAGLEVDRGTMLPAKIVFDEEEDVWMVDNGDGTPHEILTETTIGNICLEDLDCVTLDEKTSPINTAPSLKDQAFVFDVETKEWTNKDYINTLMQLEDTYVNDREDSFVLMYKQPPVDDSGQPLTDDQGNVLPGRWEAVNQNEITKAGVDQELLQRNVIDTISYINTDPNAEFGNLLDQAGLVGDAPYQIAAGDHQHHYNDLIDVNIRIPVNDHIVVYNATTQKWENKLLDKVLLDDIQICKVVIPTEFDDGFTNINDPANLQEWMESARDLFARKDLDTTFEQNVCIQGNLHVKGEITTVDTEQLFLADNIVTLNSNWPEDKPPVENAGLEVSRGTEAMSMVIYDESPEAHASTYGASGVWKVDHGDGIQYAIGGPRAFDYLKGPFEDFGLEKATLVSVDHPLQIGGSDGMGNASVNTNLIFDDERIMVRQDGSLTTLYLQWDPDHDSNGREVGYIYSSSKIKTTDGLLSDPAYSFEYDTDTGIYRKADGELGFSNEGILRLYTAAEGIVVQGNTQSTEFTLARDWQEIHEDQTKHKLTMHVDTGKRTGDQLGDFVFTPYNEKFPGVADNKSQWDRDFYFDTDENHWTFDNRLVIRTEGTVIDTDNDSNQLSIFVDIDKTAKPGDFVFQPRLDYVEQTTNRFRYDISSKRWVFDSAPYGPYVEEPATKKQHRMEVGYIRGPQIITSNSTITMDSVPGGDILSVSWILHIKQEKPDPSDATQVVTSKVRQMRIDAMFGGADSVKSSDGASTGTDIFFTNYADLGDKIPVRFWVVNEAGNMVLKLENKSGMDLICVSKRVFLEKNFENL